MMVCDIYGLSQYNTQLICYPVNAVIFLAPLSGFNQVLDEDEDVNRLVRATWQVLPQLSSCGCLGRLFENLESDLQQ